MILISLSGFHATDVVGYEVLSEPLCTTVQKVTELQPCIGPEFPVHWCYGRMEKMKLTGCTRVRKDNDYNYKTLHMDNWRF